MLPLNEGIPKLIERPANQNTITEKNAKRAINLHQKKKQEQTLSLLLATICPTYPYCLKGLLGKVERGSLW